MSSSVASRNHRVNTRHGSRHTKKHTTTVRSIRRTCRRHLICAFSAETFKRAPDTTDALPARELGRCSIEHAALAEPCRTLFAHARDNTEPFNSQIELLVDIAARLERKFTKLADIEECVDAINKRRSSVTRRLAMTE